jgi:hypothetical protein
LTADNRYQVEVKAGESQHSFSEDVMDTIGTYKITASYFTAEPDSEVVRTYTTFKFTAEE